MAQTLLFELLKSQQAENLFTTSCRFIKRNTFQDPKNQGHQLFEIVEGALKVGYYTKYSTQVLYDVLTPGELFGNFGAQYQSDFDFIQAVTHVKVRVFDCHEVINLAINDPKISKALQEIVTRKKEKIKTRVISNCSENLSFRFHLLLDQLKHVLKDNSINAILNIDEIAQLIGRSDKDVLSTLYNDTKLVAVGR